MRFCRSAARIYGQRNDVEKRENGDFTCAFKETVDDRRVRRKCYSYISPPRLEHLQCSQRRTARERALWFRRGRCEDVTRVTMRGRHGRRTEETVLSQPGWAGHGPPGIQVEVTEEEEEEAEERPWRGRAREHRFRDLPCCLEAQRWRKLQQRGERREAATAGS